MQRKYSRVLLIVAVVGLLIGGYFVCRYCFSGQVKRGITCDGIDVSHYQGRIGWKEVCRDKRIKFAYIKATEGTSIKDRRTERNLREARRHGLKVGAYHVLTLNTSPERQFENFRHSVPKEDIDLIPAIDIEPAVLHRRTAEQVNEYALEIARLMKAYYGRKPLIYTTAGKFNRYLHRNFSSYYLWIAGYSRFCPLLLGNTHVNIWQYTEHGSIDGHRGCLDLDCLVNGTTVEDLMLR